MVSPESASRWQLAYQQVTSSIPHPRGEGRRASAYRVGQIPAGSLHPTRLDQAAEPPSRQLEGWKEM